MNNPLGSLTEISLLVREITRAVNGLTVAITLNSQAMRALTQALDDAAGTEVEE